MVPVEIEGTKGVKYVGVAVDDPYPPTHGWFYAIKGKEPQTCRELLAREVIIDGDIYPDCKVDFMDLSIFAGQWLSCNDPNTDNCP